MKYKLICIDMDGTMLDEKGEVTAQNKRALKAAYEKGVNIAITTGRIFQCATLYADLIGVSGPVISSNGAYIGIKGKKEPIYQSIMSKKALYDFYKAAKKYDVITYFFTTWGVVADKAFSKEHPYVILNQSLPQEEHIRLEEVENFEEAFEKYDGTFLKAICIEEKERWKLGKLREELEAYESFEVVTSWENNIEIMSAQTSKGHAVKKLAEYLNIQREQVICIGDSENDLSMIEYAGLGIAMENALPEVKEAAKYITTSNRESGVAKAIEKFILE